MFSGETIICFAPDPWQGLWRNRHQIMTRLARRNTVLYVEPRLHFPETWRRFRDGRLRFRDLWAPLAVRFPGAGDLCPEHRGMLCPEQRGTLWIYHDPYYAPYSGRLSGGPLTAALRRRALLRTLRSFGHSWQLGRGQVANCAPILWLLRPYHADQIGQYGEKLVVYHVTDEYSAYPIVANPAAFLREEEALLRRADLVIVTSPSLLERKGRFNPHTYLVPNAVDYEGFRRAQLATWPQPSCQLAPAGGPDVHRIGYAGALNEKLDYRLLAEVARARPDWQIILIGTLDLYSQKDKAAPLAGLPNVRWLGPVPLDQLPQAIAALEVCLLPYELSEWTANIDSLKLYEYLACGRPVVSTPIPAARTLQSPTAAPSGLGAEPRRADPSLVRIAGDAAGFVAEIAAALAEDDPALVERRKMFAAANTWEDRVARIEELLSAALAR